MFDFKAPLRLWREARQLLVELWNLCGPPSAIASEDVLDKRTYDVLRQWLRGCEAVLRALLLIEAAALCVAGDLAPRQARASRVRPPRLKRVQELEHSETWRVRFRVLDPARRPRPRRGAIARRLGPPLYNAWPLAERAEACLRVFNNPAPLIRRLARTLKADPRQSLRINASGDNHRRVVMDHIWAEICRAVIDARARLPNSS